MVKQTKVEDYNPDDYLEENPDFELPLLSDLLDKTFKVTGAAFDTASRGDYAVVDTESGKYRTSSSVLLDKLAKMHSKLDKGISIRVSLHQKQGQKGSYYYFDVPE